MSIPPGTLPPPGLSSLGDFTSEGLILLDLPGSDPSSLIQTLSQALQREQRIPDLLPFYHAALNREFLCSTANGAGLAFPHARIASLEHISFALGRCPKPVAWGSPGAPLVRLIFLLAVPATSSTEYLLLISALARAGTNRALLDKLLTVADAPAALRLLKETRVQAPRPAGG